MDGCIKCKRQIIHFSKKGNIVSTRKHNSVLRVNSIKFED